MAFDSEFPVLELFIDKTHKLENSGFVNKIRQEFTLDINIDFSRTDVLEITSIRPNQENIDAFILTFSGVGWVAAFWQPNKNNELGFANSPQPTNN